MLCWFSQIEGSLTDIASTCGHRTFQNSRISFLIYLRLVQHPRANSSSTEKKTSHYLSFYVCEAYLRHSTSVVLLSF